MDLMFRFGSLFTILFFIVIFGGTVLIIGIYIITFLKFLAVKYLEYVFRIK